jgi:hypothetical protein
MFVITDSIMKHPVFGLLNDIRIISCSGEWMNHLKHEMKGICKDAVLT